MTNCQWDTWCCMTESRCLPPILTMVINLTSIVEGGMQGKLGRETWTGVFVFRVDWLGSDCWCLALTSGMAWTNTRATWLNSCPFPAPPIPPSPAHYPFFIWTDISKYIVQCTSIPTPWSYHGRSLSYVCLHGLAEWRLQNRRAPSCDSYLPWQL